MVKGREEEGFIYGMKGGDRTVLPVVTAHNDRVALTFQTPPTCVQMWL